MERLVVDGAIFGLQKAGGISRLFAEILLGIEESFAREHVVILLLPKTHNVEWLRVAPYLKHIRVVKRRRFRWGRRKAWQERLYLTRLALRLRPTTWHSSFFVGFPHWPCKKIASLYDMIPEVLSIASSYETEMKYLTLKQAHEVLSISDHSQRDLRSLWPHIAQKSKVMPMCTYISMTMDSKPKQLYFIYVGVRKGYKNFLPMMRILLQDPRFASHAFYVVGGEEEWSEEERITFETLNAWERISKKGILPQDKVQKLIAASDALLFPSLYEGFGLPVLEAFLSGVPVLCCRTSSIPEITGETYPLADVNDSKSFGETLLRLLEEKEKWISYGKQRGVHFSREKMMSFLNEVYATL